MKKTLTLLTIVATLTGCATPNPTGESTMTHAARMFVKGCTEKEVYDPFTGQTGYDDRAEKQIFGNAVHGDTVR